MFQQPVAKKSVKFEDFQQNNCVFMKTIAGSSAFQKINHKKCVNFAFFWPSNHIFTQQMVY